MHSFLLWNNQGHDGGWGHPPECAGTIVELAVGTPDLSTLVAAVTAADLVETLSGDGPFTVFGKYIILWFVYNAIVVFVGVSNQVASILVCV